MADLKPIYLVHGDDDARIDEWRSRVRRRAESELGPGGLESFDARSTPPQELAGALATLSLTGGTRYLLADEVQAWKAGDLTPLTDAIAAMPPDTVLVLIARGKPPMKALVKAVGAAGGEVREHAAPKPWEMHKWVVAHATGQGLRLDNDAAKTLLTIVGTGQQRLAREIEKLAIAVHPETVARGDDVERFAAGEAAPKVYDLADAVVTGDAEITLTLAEELGAQDERPSRLVYPVVTRLREVRHALSLLEAEVAEKDLAGAMKMPPWKVKKTVVLARRADREVLERAICRFADLEYELRGGGSLPEDTAVTLALAGAAA